MQTLTSTADLVESNIRFMTVDMILSLDWFFHRLSCSSSCNSSLMCDKIKQLVLCVCWTVHLVQDFLLECVLSAGVSTDYLERDCLWLLRAK